MRKNIVITYGTFDLLHYGHILLLKRAKKLGNYLIVGLSSDEFNTLKGKKSYFNYNKRKELIKSLKFVDKERLNQLTNENHQGVVAMVAAYQYAKIQDLFDLAEKKGESPFFFLLDGIEDPHNLGAIIRTANLAGAHGVIIPKNRAVGLTPAVAKTSAGAIHYTPVVKVTNLTRTMEELKENVRSLARHFRQLGIQLVE